LVPNARVVVDAISVDCAIYKHHGCWCVSVDARRQFVRRVAGQEEISPYGEHGAIGRRRCRGWFVQRPTRHQSGIEHSRGAARGASG